MTHSWPSTAPLWGCTGPALAIATECKAFRTPELEAIRVALRTPVVLEGRNLYEPAVIASFGLEYHCIGKPAIDVPVATARP